MKNKILHIALAEPSVIVRNGLIKTISEMIPAVKWQYAGSVSELHRMLSMSPIDLVLVSPMLAVNQEKAVQQLRAEFVAVRFIAILTQLYEPALLSLFDASLQLTDEPAAIQNLVIKNTGDEKSDDTSTQQPLTDRELDVLKLLVTGISNKEIADKLFISVNTVITHRKNIVQKTGIKSVSGLTIYAVVKGIIQLE